VTEVDCRAPAGARRERAILLLALVMVVGGWAAPALGLNVAATGVALAACFALLVALVLRRRDRRRDADAAMPGGRVPRWRGESLDRGPGPPSTAAAGAVPASGGLPGPVDDAPTTIGPATQTDEAFLRSVIDASPDCIKVLDLAGRILFVSRNGLCLMDCETAEAIVGHDFTALWPEEARGLVHSSLAAAVAGAASRFNAHCTSMAGRPLTLDVRLSPITGEDGRVARLLVLSRDVTAGAEAEAALRKVRDRYSLLAENSSDVVMLRSAGPEGHALYVSPSCSRVLGAPPAVVLSAYPAGLVHADDLPDVRRLLATLTARDGIVLHTHRIERPDGISIWVEGAFQIAERAGEAAIVVALRDVTERQQRADDLAAAKEAAERARSSAEAASEAKSDFIASMSHEIRTPLNSIMGFTDLMLDMPDLPEEVQRHAELIRASGSALLTVVGDVLDLSKVEAGAVELEAIAFSPIALAETCVSILRGYAGTKAIAIRLEIGDDVPTRLVGDEARLRQVLLNLLNNAVKFTTQGGVTLRLVRVGATATEETIRFDVVDTGIGIPPSQQHRLFERFSQVDSSIARRFGGSGLGLFICKKLVELMGGTIGVDSQAGTGSTFWFSVTLPRRAETPQAGAEAAPALSRTGHILVVDDVELNQRLAVALLEAAGHVVDVVEDGALAVAAVARNAYDLVLMDVQMPGMDGVSATRAIRASAGRQCGVPIVAMTANVFPDQVRAFREAGMDDHIGKPLSRIQLQRTVARWIAAGPDAAVPIAPTTRGSDRSSTFDGSAYLDLVAHLGPERLDDVLARFAVSLAQRFLGGEARASTMRRWRADAHVVQSVAGMLGLAELAQQCRALEAAVPGSDDQAERLAAVRRARDAAIDRIAGLRAELTGAPGEGEAVA
jgi:PAS domain S-box-containing protein